MEIKKHCSKCRVENLLDEFHSDKAHKDGKRSECKKCQSIRIKEWNERNKGWRKERDARYHREHYCKSKRVKYHKQYYQDNKDRIKHQHQEYQMKNREAAATRTAGYRSKKLTLEATLTNEQWGVLKSMFRNRCVYCGKKTKRLEREHIIPVSLGGALSFNNIVPACHSCNAKKNVNQPIAPINLVLL